MRTVVRGPFSNGDTDGGFFVTCVSKRSVELLALKVFKGNL